MIQMFIIKQILKAISRFAKRKIDEKKLKKMHDYVFKANELDKEVVAIWKEIKILKKDSHPQADWICMECGCTAKRVETPTKK